MTNLPSTTSHTLPARIPRFIENLNALARESGMTVRMVVEPSVDTAELRLWTEWRGTRAQVLAFVRPIPSYHLPLSCGTLTVPGGSGGSAYPLLTANVTVVGDEVELEIDFGPPHFTIADIAGIEVISYADENLYHGTAAELIALGIERTRLPLGKRAGAREYNCDGAIERWSSRRQPDGTIVYRIESPAELRRRRERMAAQFDSLHNPHRSHAGIVPTTRVRPSYLRLLVDNDRQ